MTQQIEPLTEEQLAFFTEQTERAVHKTAKKIVRSALIGYAILLLGSLGMYLNGQSISKEERQSIVQSGTAVAVESCNRDFRTIGALRGVLIASRDFQVESLRRGDITQRQFDRARSYYRVQLASLPQPDCRVSRGLLTTKGDEVPSVPEPLYPDKK
jgi:hypothetical protein